MLLEIKLLSPQKPNFTYFLNVNFLIDKPLKRNSEDQIIENCYYMQFIYNVFNGFGLIEFVLALFCSC